MQNHRLGIGRLAMATALGGFMLGAAFLNSGGAHAIGGLCNGRPASHTWLDASGQYGPALIDGTRGNDVIVGSDGDDTIDGRGGNDTVCGAAGNDSISVGPGGNVHLSLPPGVIAIARISFVSAPVCAACGPPIGPDYTANC